MCSLQAETPVMSLHLLDATNLLQNHRKRSSSHRQQQGGTDMYTEYLRLVDEWRHLMTSSWALGKHRQHFFPPTFWHFIDWTRNRLKLLQALLSPTSCPFGWQSPPSCPLSYINVEQWSPDTGADRRFPLSARSHTDKTVPFMWIFVLIG